MRVLNMERVLKLFDLVRECKNIQKDHRADIYV